MRISDWSSDVCSSDLIRDALPPIGDDGTAQDRHDVEFGVARVLPDDLAKPRLLTGGDVEHEQVRRGFGDGAADLGVKAGLDARKRDEQIGRASCRERVCQYV